MKTEKDFEDLLKIFNKHKVRYCIIGAFAVAFHARPRYTKDMDIFIEPTLTNAKKVLKALKDFGFGSLTLSPNDFTKKGKFIQLGYEPVRIDLVTSIPGCTFSQTWKNKAIGPYGQQKVFFIDLHDLIKNKQASNRKQDKADLEILQKQMNSKKTRKSRQK